MRCASRPFGPPSFPRQCSAAACGLRPGHPCGVPPIKSAPPPPNRDPFGAELLKGGQARLAVLDGLCAVACVRRATEFAPLGRVEALPGRLLPPQPRVPRTLGQARHAPEVAFVVCIGPVWLSEKGCHHRLGLEQAFAGALEALQGASEGADGPGGRKRLYGPSVSISARPGPPRHCAEADGLLLEQQDDVVRDAGCDQHGVLVVAERVAVVLDDDDSHCFHLLSGPVASHLFMRRRRKSEKKRLDLGARH